MRWMIQIYLIVVPGVDVRNASLDQPQFFLHHHNR